MMFAAVVLLALFALFAAVAMRWIGHARRSQGLSVPSGDERPPLSRRESAAAWAVGGGAGAVMAWTGLDVVVDALFAIGRVGERLRARARGT